MAVRNFRVYLTIASLFFLTNFSTCCWCTSWKISRNIAYANTFEFSCDPSLNHWIFHWISTQDKIFLTSIITNSYYSPILRPTPARSWGLRGSKVTLNIPRDDSTLTWWSASLLLILHSMIKYVSGLEMQRKCKYFNKTSLFRWRNTKYYVLTDCH